MEKLKLLYSQLSHKRFITAICLSVILLQTLQILYLNRATFTERYDVEYWKDRYDHSQWQLLHTERPIGDDGLYAYVGYRLLKGADPSLVITDKPPAALYLIGASIVFLGNPAYFALIFGFGSLICLYFISRKLLSSSIVALLVVTFFYLDPLFFSQLSKSLLDIYQLFFLLLNLVAFVYLAENKKRVYLWAFVSGLAVLLFFETKMQVLFPVLIGLESVYLLFYRRIKDLVIYIIGAASAILLVFAKYLLLGHNLFQLFQFHKYIARIYLISKLPVQPKALIDSVFLGKVPDVVTGALNPVQEWIWLWPVLVVAALLATVAILFSKQSALLKGVAIITLTTLILYSRIPFYTRYLLLVLPLFYLLAAWLVQRYIARKLLVFMFVPVLLGLFYYVHIFFRPAPEPLLQAYYYNLSHQHLSDIYEENIVKSSLGMSRNQFRDIGQGAFHDAQVKAIEIKELSNKFNSESGQATIQVVYKTQDLGFITEEKTLHLQNDQNRWRIVWNWDNIFDGFTPESKVVTNIVLGKRGKITKMGQLIAEDREGYLISVNPSKVAGAKEEELLELLTKYIPAVRSEIHDYYVQNRTSDDYVPLATTFQELELKDKALLESYSGVRLTPYASRIYVNGDHWGLINTSYTECCTRIYSSSNYHGRWNTDKDFDEVLSGHSGGSIVIQDREGKVKKVVILKDPHNGQDVVVN